jgi:Ca2+/H+ antiporter, TMEM165/GDT1 family
VAQVVAPTLAKICETAAIGKGARMEALIAGVTAFVLIVPIELPDKTFVATLVLSTRYRPIAVWLGVIGAFFVQCVVAVTAGRLVQFLPERPVRLVTAGLFLLGAILLVRGAGRADQLESEQASEVAKKVGGTRRTGLAAFGTSFLVLFAAEWGDLSQLLTAGLVARGGHPVAVFLGSWTGLALVSGLAVLSGKVLLRYIRLSMIRYIGAAVCAALAIWTVVVAFT